MMTNNDQTEKFITKQILWFIHIYKPKQFSQNIKLRKLRLCLQTFYLIKKINSKEFIREKQQKTTMKSVIISILISAIIAIIAIDKVSSQATQPVYRCVSSNGLTHWASTDKTCSGGSYQLILGYAYTSPHSGTTAIYRCANSAGTDYMTSTSSSCASGYTNQALLGYIYTSRPSSPATTTLYRCLTSSGNHFTSTSSTCEGMGLVNSVLGYINTSPWILFNLIFGLLFFK